MVPAALSGVTAAAEVPAWHLQPAVKPAGKLELGAGADPCYREGTRKRLLGHLTATGHGDESGSVSMQAGAARNRDWSWKRLRSGKVVSQT